MKGSKLFVVVALIGLAACGTEGPLVRSKLTSPRPTATAEVTPAAETTRPTDSPEPTQTPTSTPQTDTPAPSEPAGDNAGIFGSVVAGPTCPVEQENSPCPDRPVPGAEVTAKTPSGETAGTTRADDQGKFTLRLAPGSYDVTAGSRDVMSCDTQRVDVADHQYTPVRITCDTGIR